MIENIQLIIIATLLAIQSVILWLILENVHSLVKKQTKVIVKRRED